MGVRETIASRLSRSFWGPSMVGSWSPTPQDAAFEHECDQPALLAHTRRTGESTATRGFFEWRDPDSNWGHHDFQSSMRTDDISRIPRDVRCTSAADSPATSWSTWSAGNPSPANAAAASSSWLSARRCA